MLIESNNRAEDFTVAYTLADVFLKHDNVLSNIVKETGITYATLAKHRDMNTLDTFLFIRCPDGSISQYTLKASHRSGAVE